MKHFILTLLVVMLLVPVSAQVDQAFFRDHLLTSPAPATVVKALEKLADIPADQVEDATFNKVATLLSSADPAIAAQAALTLANFGEKGQKFVTSHKLVKEMAIANDGTKADPVRLAAINNLVGKELNDVILVEVKKCAESDADVSIRKVAVKLIIDHFTTQVTAANNAKTTTENALATANNKVTELTNKVATLETEKGALVLTLADVKTEAGNLNKKLTETNTALSITKTELEKVTTGIASLKTKYSQFFKDLAGNDHQRMGAMIWARDNKVSDLKDVVVQHLRTETYGNARYYGVEFLLAVKATGNADLIQFLLAKEPSVNVDIFPLYKKALGELK